ncbi:RsmD family RNA methyltransferase [Bifidobacterium gallicum]|uniref:RNA methyltransferase, RsmD family n=1 Tax=Bifidobacterium gallicum DSM 20093 = LMG 11596 TaxID=561180 RepID=D1NUF9_9BIFI|nr:RsmD family RNA methyltransferase [Bifidobacterium gallicum]EFA23363.1 RNA methyltransferase, RsmD family [Bifidobacterium gallicum DSM 20093 = LMG 11596]KFI57879.1 RNA methyltransferase, RsmD family [Bifidobacterium gallicum DSM 20093 = LMG 11596]
MRIIAGRFKGVPLTTPRSGTRPTTDRTKEAIFSRLDARQRVDGARVLDLYAGTGALGFEALSRGAQSCVFVEYSAPAAKLIAQTATALKAQRAWEPSMSVHVVKAKAERYVEKMAGHHEDGLFDLVLIDPPYAVTTDDCNALLERLVSGELVHTPQAGHDEDRQDEASHDGPEQYGPLPLIMLERSTRSKAPTAPTGWTLADRRDYGETAVFYFSPDCSPAQA